MSSVLDSIAQTEAPAEGLRFGSAKIKSVQVTAKLVVAVALETQYMGSLPEGYSKATPATLDGVSLNYRGESVELRVSKAPDCQRIKSKVSLTAYLNAVSGTVDERHSLLVQMLEAQAARERWESFRGDPKKRAPEPETFYAEWIYATPARQGRLNLEATDD